MKNPRPPADPNAGTKAERAAGRRTPAPRASRARPAQGRPSTVVEPVKVAPDAGPPLGRQLPLPHERDESTGQVDPRPQEVIRQAQRDIEAGLVDTDLRATPGLDADTRARLLKKEARRR